MHGPVSDNARRRPLPPDQQQRPHAVEPGVRRRPPQRGRGAAATGRRSVPQTQGM